MKRGAQFSGRLVFVMKEQLTNFDQCAGIRF
ncbi:hypothetical protein V473_11130 [Sphingobium cupriresistens LL01]|uniref:Uncharacterized protein n=1 Tax=Sphingobium cupriresistens LL01 TaxID=1420583 RepID=A0A0J7Y669_9SPHN|nr:hypothetical protein V473_11130 [Sphingobium cupriresistens LL01]